MNEKKRKKKLITDLDNFLLSPRSQQTRSYGAALENLDEEDFERIDDACTKLVTRLQYANLASRTRITYNDGLEILAKLGMFLSLVDPNNKDDRHG